MTKIYFSIVVFLLFVNPVNGQGEAALPFLYYQQSPLLIGAGGIGAAISSDDASGFYYNPAQLGNYSRENNFSIFFMPQKTKWGKDFSPNYTFQTFGLSAGYNFGKNDDNLPLSIGVGYLHNKFSYGEFVRTGPDSPDPLGTYESYDAFDCFSVGLGYEKFFRFNLGMSAKFYTSLLSDYPTSQNFSQDGTKGTAFDFGVMIVTPISKLFPMDQNINIGEGTFLKPKVDFTVGYSLLNVGKEIVYADPAQKDPLPRTARLGYSFDFGLGINTMSWKINAIDYSFTAEADDILVKRNLYAGSPEYDNIFGVISPAKHLIGLKSDGSVVVHRGHVLRLFETIIITSGRFSGRTLDVMKANGIGFSSEGLVKLYSAYANNSIVSYAANHFVLEYYNANNFVDSYMEMNFRGLILSIRGIEF